MSETYWERMPAHRKPLLRQERSLEHLEFQRECVELFGELVQVLGIPKSVGQIYGLIYAADRPHCFADIVVALGISKGSVSQGLQMLRTLGAVRLVSCNNIRRQYFVPELGLRHLVGGVIRERIEPLIPAGHARIDRLKRIAKLAPAHANPFLNERIDKLEQWNRQIALVLPMFNALLGTGRSR